MRHLRAIALICSLLLIGTAAAACGGLMPDGVVYPSIDLDETVTEDYTVTPEFTFEGAPVSFTVTVDGSLYAGAAAAEKSVIRFGGARENDWIEDYYPAFIDDPHLEQFYADVLTQLRAIRDARGLDADRYAELLTVYVQSITYQTDPVDLSPKFPIETFVEGAGDCDDKTLLLAGLLKREGYDVAILLFEQEQHVSLGIRSPEIEYSGTGYAFVETTANAFIGMVPDEFAGGITLTSQPTVFPLSQGLPYTAGAQVRAILDGRAAAVAEAEQVTVQISAADASLLAEESALSALRSRLDSYKASGRNAEYNALVPEYNAQVESYNVAADERNRLAERYNALAELDSAIIEGLADRVGTYRRVAEVL